MDSWIRLSYIDDEFKTFSYKEGRKLFIDHFTEVIDAGEYKKWTIFNKRHRENDKPACIYDDNSRFWYINDELHRNDDKPAVIDADGTKKWYQHGKYRMFF